MRGHFSDPRPIGWAEEKGPKLAWEDLGGKGGGGWHGQGFINPPSWGLGQSASDKMWSQVLLGGAGTTLPRTGHTGQGSAASFLLGTAGEGGDLGSFGRCAPGRRETWQLWSVGC